MWNEGVVTKFKALSRYLTRYSEANHVKRPRRSEGQDLRPLTGYEKNSANHQALTSCSTTLVSNRYNCEVPNLTSNKAGIDTEVRSYSECVCSLSYPAYRAYASYSNVICGLSSSAIFFDIISQTAKFGGGGEVIEHKTYFDLLCNFCLKHFSS